MLNGLFEKRLTVTCSEFSYSVEYQEEAGDKLIHLYQQHLVKESI
jgi:hypothetical protein